MIRTMLTLSVCVIIGFVALLTIVLIVYLFASVGIDATYIISEKIDKWLEEKMRR